MVAGPAVSPWSNSWSNLKRAHVKLEFGVTPKTETHCAPQFSSRLLRQILHQFVPFDSTQRVVWCSIVRRISCTTPGATAEMSPAPVTCSARLAVIPRTRPGLNTSFPVTLRTQRAVQKSATAITIFRSHQKRLAVSRRWSVVVSLSLNVENMCSDHCCCTSVL